MSCFLPCLVCPGQRLLINTYISLLTSYAIGLFFRDNELKAQQPSVWSSFVKPWRRKVLKMASKEIAAMLDTLMGKNRNTEVSSAFSDQHQTLRDLLNCCVQKGFPPVSSPHHLLSRTLRGCRLSFSVEWLVRGGTMGMWGFFLRLTGYIVQQTNIPLLIAILAVLMIDGKPAVSDLVIELI